MNQVNKTLPGQGAFGQHSAIISNADALWKQALRDNKDGTKLINNNGSLRHEDHRRIQEQLIEIRRRELNGIMDLMNAGLTSQEDINTMLVGYETVNEFQDAKRSMNPTALQDNNTDFKLNYTPLPITHQSWSIPWRQQGFAYKRSLGLSESVRQVSESLEDMLFNGASDIVVSVDGVTNSSIFGYTNHPNRVAAGISDWSLPGTTGETIVSEMIDLVKQARLNNASQRPDSLMVYVGNDVWSRLAEDYSSAKGDNTILQRLLAITEIMDIKPAEYMPLKDVMLVEMDDRTIQLAVASDIVTIPHQRQSELENQLFTTYGAMVPIIRSDRNDKTGIVHGVESL